MIAAACRLCFFCLLSHTLWCAGTATGNYSLTVLIDFDAPHSEASLRSLRENLGQLLSPSGFDASVQLKQDTPENTQFGELVIFKMKGTCSMGFDVPFAARQIGPLALAYTSDGKVLHFGEVECDRIRNSLQKVLGFDGSARNQAAFGKALAIVMAHEVYHMLGNAFGHTHDGLTKPALSPSELLDSKLALPQRAISAIGSSLHPASP